jgi:uncharacterized protein YciI
MGDGLAQWLVVLTPPRPTFADDASEEEQAAVGGHFAYLEELSERGVVLLAGRTLDAPPMGLVILQAVDLGAAWAMVEGDPAVAGGIFTAEVRPYRVALEGFRGASSR